MYLLKRFKKNELEPFEIIKFHGEKLICSKCGKNLSTPFWLDREERELYCDPCSIRALLRKAGNVAFPCIKEVEVIKDG